MGRRGVALPFAPKDVMLDEVSVSGGRIEITKQGVPQLALDERQRRGQRPVAVRTLQGLGQLHLRGPPARASLLDQRARCGRAVPHQVGAARPRSQHHLPARRRRDRARRHAGLSTARSSCAPRMSLAQATEDAAADAENDSQPAGAAPRDKSFALRVERPAQGHARPRRASRFRPHHPRQGSSADLQGQAHARFRRARRPRTARLRRALSISMPCSRCPGAEERPSPATVLYMFADEVLTQAAELGDGTLHVAIEQAGLGGDLVGAVDMALAAKDGALTIERLKAVLPGDNRIEASGQLTRGEFGPVFAGPVKVEGSELAAAHPLGCRRPRHVGTGLGRRFQLHGQCHHRRRRAQACRRLGRAERHQVPRRLAPARRRASR